MKPITSRLAVIAIVCATLTAAAQIPVMRITTQDNQVPGYRNDPGCGGSGGGWWGGGGMTLPITVSDYVHITNFQLEVPGQPHLDITKNGEADSIRRRGNSTMTQTKIPFRLRFGSRTPLFGKERARSWPMLANHFDNTMLLNAIAFELGRRMNLEFTPTSQFVNLYLNDQYRGIYQITEQVQVNPGRVDINADFGWLAEFDFHAPASDKCSTYFTTSQYSLTTFIKSPELGNLRDSTGFRFVKNDINRLVDSMASSRFPENGYRDLVDLQSYVTYIMIQQLMDNHDFNSQSQTGGLPGSNFAYKDRGGRIKAGPLWDFDLSAGIRFVGMTPQHFSTYQRDIMPLHPFYQRFFDDPVFLARWKKTWDRYQSAIQTIPEFIDSLANFLSPSIVDNFSANSSGGGWGGGNTIQTEQQYRDSIQVLKTWWENRVQNFNQQINAMNIDTTLDISDPIARVTARAESAGRRNNVLAVKNGVNLRVSNSASLKIFTLNGREVRKIKLPHGNHTVRFSDLPKGLYMVNITIDGDRRVLRTMVK